MKYIVQNFATYFLLLCSIFQSTEHHDLFSEVQITECLWFQNIFSHVQERFPEILYHLLIIHYILHKPRFSLITTHMSCLRNAPSSLFQGIPYIFQVSTICVFPYEVDIHLSKILLNCSSYNV